MKITTINLGQNTIEVHHSLYQSVFVNGKKVSSRMAWAEHRFSLPENGDELDCKLRVGLSHGISLIVNEKPVVQSKDRTLDWLIVVLLLAYIAMQ